MKIEIHYSLGCGGFDGYRTVSLPKYLSDIPLNLEKINNWAANWLRTNLKEFRYNLDDWTVIG